jgi:Protein of unknown function (DUF2854)
MLGKISTALVLLLIGGISSAGGITYYFMRPDTLNALGLFIGMPLLIVGLGLRSAEMAPVPLTPSTPYEVSLLRDQQSTSTQVKILREVTRFLYGHEAHLDVALNRLGLHNPEEEVEFPLLKGVSETAVDGAYALVLDFRAVEFPLEVWQEKRAQMETFFGPDIRVTVEELPKKRVAVSLLRNSKYQFSP